MNLLSFLKSKRSDPKISNTPQIISSKGLKIKDNYALSPSGFAHSESALKRQISKAKEILYIKLGSDLHKLLPLLDLIKDPVTLVTTDGDALIPTELGLKKAHQILNHCKIKKWLTQNYDGSIQHPKLLPYPIGLDLHSPDWLIGGTPESKINYMLSLREQKKERIMKILCDTYTTRNRHRERQLIYEQLKSTKHVKTLCWRRGIKKIFKLYANYCFVASPPGGGIDCHRTWETLLLGAIPIVKSSSLDALYKDLPVVIVNDWRECQDFNNLNKWWNQYSKNDRTKLYFKKTKL